MDYMDLTTNVDIQRIFRARQKLVEPGYISHITQRAAGKEPLFLEDNDFLTMLALLKETGEKYSLSIYAFCLMPNHVHILLEPKEKNLDVAMRSLFSRYAIRFNRKYQRRGHLFGGPYRQAVCLDDTYLLSASVYIHLNPVRAGLSERPMDYRWSSCQLYCKENAPDSFIDPWPILSLIDQDSIASRNHYSTILNEGREVSPDNALEEEGSIEKFCIKLSQIFPSLFNRIGRRNQIKTSSKEKIHEMPQLEELLQEIRSKKPKSPETMKARKYLVEQLRARGFKHAEIASRLDVSRKTIYNILNSSK